jgi:hypothetical protein
MDWDISFPYNNIDNLLLEIRWSGDGGSNVALFRTAEAVPRRAYAWDDNASTGSLQNTSNYVKLAISTPPGIQEKPVENELASFGFAAFVNPSQGMISYTTSSPGEVLLEAYDATGRLIATLVNKVQPAGVKTINWDTSNIANGVYFLRLEAQDEIATRKMILVK